MSNDDTLTFWETGAGYNGKGDFSVLKNYLIPVSKAVIIQDPQVFEKITVHLEKANKVLKMELVRIKDLIGELKSQLSQTCGDGFFLPEPTPSIENDLRKIKFLIKKMTKVNRECINERIGVLEEQYKLVDEMIDMTQFLIDTKKRFTICIRRIVNPRDRTLYILNKKDQIHLFNLKKAANSLYIVLQLAPPPFRSNTQNRAFLDRLIDTAVRKPETSYFSELPGEKDLEYFLNMETKSPLVREGIVPYSKEVTPEAVKDWIDLATVILAEYDLTEDQDRASTIAIFCERYLFNSTYPLLYPPRNPDAELINAKMEKFRNRTPKDIGILLKYVPKELVDEPCYKIFEYDDLGKESVRWMREAEFQITPIDAAWCVVKAHEALSIMCVKREMQNKGKTSYTNEEFVEKMPGFDDIFEIWRAFIASCDLGDAKQLLSFINDYSYLPGFSARILASIAYLEASIGQLEEENE